jgi:hypothetical protein
MAYNQYNYQQQQQYGQQQYGQQQGYNQYPPQQQAPPPPPGKHLLHKTRNLLLHPILIRVKGVLL